jgi:hypothetical protein
VVTSSTITTWVNRFIGVSSFVGDNLLIDAHLKGVRSVYGSRLVGLPLVFLKADAHTLLSGTPFLDSFQEPVA